ncbi:MAG: TonB-dependent receptor [Burkholderiales bacterium PBB3]|nr:MAG: TonB-dependent receptor [Burkholderiales bacterium PBB3]
MQFSRIAQVCVTGAAAFPFVAVSALAQNQAPAPFATSSAADTPSRSLGVVTILSGQPTSLPTQIPTTMQGVTGEDIANTINATDSEDALKYFPSLLVRKRYIGDYNHAVLSSRASGTGNSARSAVYVDGVLVSNYLGNGATYAPRWGMVTPEEIARVDVMYGPFSAAYPGNSVGAVVDYVTRMPTQLQANARIGISHQPNDLYGANTNYQARQASASVGSKAGDWSWFVNLNRTDSNGQPLTFATRLKSVGVASTAGTAVTGAVLDANNANVPWFNLGSVTQYHTIQDHAKLKLAYDITPTLRAHYTLASWSNTSEGRGQSYLKDASGNTVSSGAININGLAFTGANALTGADFVATNEALRHLAQGLSLKTRTQGVLDWELAANQLNYDQDLNRRNSAGNVLPGALAGGAGTVADGGGTGWKSLALKGTWRPQVALSKPGEPAVGSHVVDFGLQQDRYRLSSITSNIPGNWITDAPGSLVNAIGGTTTTQAAYVQDSWTLAKDWKTVLGLRLENWAASDGQTTFGPGNPANRNYDSRSESFASPKAALSYQWAADTVLKASLGRAVRFPTVAELYGATAATNSQYINDPNLLPEKSWTTELSAEKEWAGAQWRATFFGENTQDALYSQTTFDAQANRNISRVQNIGRIATTGLELAVNAENVWRQGLDLSGSVTYTDSTIRENAGFVAVAGDTIGKRQPNIPAWRATALASYRWSPQWITSLGLRYSGPQFRTLNNADVNGFTYQGVSEYFTADVRARYQFNKQVSAAVGIDNLNNYQYWNFHPYPQRTFSAELQWNL